MAISRTAVLTGHVVSSLIQAVGGMAIVVGVALLVGFNPNANAAEWVAAAGLVAFFSLGLIWLSCRPRTAGEERGDGEQHTDAPDTVAVPQQRVRAHRLDADGDALVRRDTSRSRQSSRPSAACCSAPASAITASLRIAWSVVITVGSYRWARRQFNRPSINRPSVLAH